MNEAGTEYMIGGDHIPKSEFAAVVTEAEVVNSDFDDSQGNPRKSLHLRLETDEGKERHAYYPISERPRSKFGKLNKALGDIGIKSITATDLVGKRFRFREEEIRFGPDISGSIVLPVEKLRTESQSALGRERQVKEETKQQPIIEAESGMRASEEVPGTGSDDCSALIKEALRGGKTLTKAELGRKAREAGYTPQEFTEALSKLVEDGEVFEGTAGYDLWE